MDIDTTEVPVDSIDIDIDARGRVVLEFFGGQKWPLKMAFAEDGDAEQFATFLELAAGLSKVSLSRGRVEIAGNVDGSVTLTWRNDIGFLQPGWPPGGFLIPAEGTKPTAREIRQRMAMRKR